MAAPKKSQLKVSKMAGLKDDMKKKYGPKSARMGSEKVELNVIPSGILAFDYATGIGGFPRGHATGVYGTRDIGKSVHAALAVANAQKLGLEAAWIAYETTFDPEWVEMFGVNVDDLLIVYPKNGEEAFQMLYRIVEAEAGIVVFDSIGSVLGESETGADSKARQGGQAGLISWGVKNVVPLAYHTNTAIIFINQARADMGARYAGATSQPGGYALEHMEAMIVHLKGGKNRFMEKVMGEDIEVGREIVAVFERNKLSQGSRRKALYGMYFAEHGGHTIGVDLVEDVLATGKRSGAIVQGGAYYTLPSGLKIHTKEKLAAHLYSNPDAVTEVRDAILASMDNKQTGPKLEVVNP